MTFKAIYTILICLLFSVAAQAKVLVYSGKVIDSSTKLPLPGAAVSIPDLRISGITNQNGEFTFNNTPAQGRFLIEIKYIGYKTLTQLLDFSNPVSDFLLQPSVIEAAEVVVTGSAFSSDSKKNSTSVSSVTKDQLVNRPSTNLIDAISKIPGVSQVTTGGGISKPVIRGLSYNRVLTLVDGTKQEGQQWGDEHGIEVDQYGAERIEILRGAASLLYGSDALGGVINVLDAIPPADGDIRGEVLSNFATNNGMSSSSAMLQGNSSGLVWRARSTYKSAFAYNTPEGRIPNTGYKENAYSGEIGLNKQWGYSHLNLSSFRTDLGLPDFERNGAGQFKDENGNVFSSSQLKSREMLLPYQNVRHYKAALNSNILLGPTHLRSTFSFQNNQRREFEASTVDPTLFFDLKTYSFDLKYYLPEAKGWEKVIGASGASQSSRNKAEELLIPDYDALNYGIFTYAKKTWKKSTFNLGARFDYRQIQGIEMEEEGSPKFSDFKNDFSNVSGALGFTHEFTDKLNLKSNLGTAFRAPNIAELSSEGVHEGTFRYELGNVALKPEYSYYGDVSLEYNTGTLSAGLNFYYNSINNYIYNRQDNNETIIAEGDLLPFYRYVQDNATLYGTEATLTLHPVELIHFENSFSFTRAQNKATGNPLPFIPAATLRNELRIEPGAENNSRHNYFSIELQNSFRQNRIDKFETQNPAYTLVNIAAGTSFNLNKQTIRFNLSANNLFDKAYTEHLSRLKYVGILNQGRNISFGIYVPLSLQ